MVECGKCRREAVRKCPLCTQKYCYYHKLPEFHQCSNIDPIKELEEIEEEKRTSSLDPEIIEEKTEDFEIKPSNFNPLGGLSSSQQTSSVSETEKIQKKVETEDKTHKNIGLDFSRTGNKITFFLVGLMLIIYMIQIFVLFSFGSRLHDLLFVLHPRRIFFIWTWVTSIFAHSPTSFFHLLINGAVLLFFGTLIERRVGGKKFLSFFLFTGIVSGLVQTLISLITASNPRGILGASGAVIGILGALTILDPYKKIFLIVVPMPLWLATLLFASYDILLVGLGGIGSGGVARLAHLSGLTIGFLYGWKLKNKELRSIRG